MRIYNKFYNFFVESRVSELCSFNNNLLLLKYLLLLLFLLVILLLVANFTSACGVIFLLLTLNRLITCVV